MLNNLVLALHQVWAAGFGVCALAAAAPRARQLRFLLIGAVTAVPAAFLLDYYRWALGGRELLEGLLTAFLVILVVVYLGSRHRHVLRGEFLLWTLLGFFLPQAALWDMVRWPFTFSSPPPGIAAFLDGQLLAEVAGVILGLSLALAGLVLLIYLGRTCPPGFTTNIALAVLGIYLAERLGVLAQILAATGLWSPGIFFNLLARVINLLPWFPDLLLVTGLVWAALSWYAFRHFPPVGTDMNPAKRRRAVAVRLYRRRLAQAAGSGLLVALSLVAWQQAQAARPVELSPPVPMTAREGVVRIPLAELEDGKLRRYSFTASDGTQVRFIALNKGGGLYGAALDYCEFCGLAGYSQRGEVIICTKCDVVINRVTVGFSGGCNPVPLPSRREESYLVIAVEDLEKNKDKFVEGS